MSSKQAKMLAQLKKQKENMAKPAVPAQPPATSSTTDASAKNPAMTASHAKTNTSASASAAPRNNKRPAPHTPATAEALTQATKKKTAAGASALQVQMEEKLQGAQFRWLNEKLYTTTSGEVRHSHSTHKQLSMESCIEQCLLCICVLFVCVGDAADV